MEGLFRPLVTDVADGDGEGKGEEPDEEEVTAKKRDGSEGVDRGCLLYTSPSPRDS